MILTVILCLFLPLIVKTAYISKMNWNQGWKDLTHFLLIINLLYILLLKWCDYLMMTDKKSGWSA